jgi:hypothetical protein
MAAAKAAIDVWSGVVDPLVDKMKKYYPDDEKRANFSKRIQQDMANESYHLYSPMYVSTSTLFMTGFVLLVANPMLRLTSESLR